MLRRLFKFSLVSSLLLSIAASSVYASGSIPDVNDAKPEFIRLADQAIIEAGSNPEKRIENLENLGWTLVETDEAGIEGIAPMSNVGCGKIENQPVLEHIDYITNRTMYLIQADWSFTCNQTSWDAGSHNAPDYVAIGVVTNTNQAADVMAEYAMILAQDQNDNYYPSSANISAFYGGGLTASINDESVVTRVGIKGKVWFYVTKPTNPGVSSYYIRSTWQHTWADKGMKLKEVKIGYPWAVSATWEGTTVPSSWPNGGVSDQDYISYFN